MIQWLLGSLYCVRIHLIQKRRVLSVELFICMFCIWVKESHSICDEVKRKFCAISFHHTYSKNMRVFCCYFSSSCQFFISFFFFLSQYLNVVQYSLFPSFMIYIRPRLSSKMPRPHRQLAGTHDWRPKFKFTELGQVFSTTKCLTWLIWELCSWLLRYS